MYTIHEVRTGAVMSFCIPPTDFPARLEAARYARKSAVGGKVKGQGVKAGKDAKTPVVSLVQRDGKARSFVVESVTAKNLRPIINEHVHGWSQVMTDDATVYPYVLKGKVASHDVVCHSKEEYSRKEDGKNIHTNTVEGFFSILKRGIIGTFHHVSKQHLDRYLSEFDFRYNSRDTDDGDRAELAVKGVVGKRLTYRPRVGIQN